jgi:hypothetical protein
MHSGSGSAKSKSCCSGSTTLSYTHLCTIGYLIIAEYWAFGSRFWLVFSE